MEPYVRPDGAHLHSLVTTNDEFAAAFSESVRPEERIALHNQAIVTGYRAIAGAQGNGSLMTLSQQLESSVKTAGDHAMTASKELKTALEAHFAPTGAFGKVLQGMDATLVQHLGPGSPQLAAFRERTRADFAEGAKAILGDVRALFNLADETSPFAKLARDVASVSAEIVKVHGKLDSQAQVAQARRAIPLNAGRDLEVFVHDVLAPIASIHAEPFEDVRDVPSSTKGRAKVGDFVSTLDPRLTRSVVARVVIEAKNRRTSTVGSLLVELDEAMNARQAVSALGILTNPKAKGRPISGYGGNKVIVLVPTFGDPDCDYEIAGSLIELGYEYARLLAAARVTTSLTEALDLSTILTAVDELAEAIRSFKQLTDNHTRISSAVEAARVTATAIRDKLDGSTKQIRALIEEEVGRLESRKALPSSSTAA